MAEDTVSEQNIDWEGIKASSEFQELVKQKRAFVIPATIFFLTYYMAFIVLCAYASDFMGRSVYEGLTVGYTLALTQFLMVLVLGLMYLKRSASVFDPLADKAVALHAVPDDDVSTHRRAPEPDGGTGAQAANGQPDAEDVVHSTRPAAR